MAQTTTPSPFQPQTCPARTMIATPGISPIVLATGNEVSRERTIAQTFARPVLGGPGLSFPVAANMIGRRGSVRCCGWKSRPRAPSPSRSGTSARRSNPPVARPNSAAAPTAAPMAPADVPPIPRIR